MSDSKNLTKQERVNFILHKLQVLYPAPPIPLHHKDPYTLLVAVLLSAQCTDERVNQVTPALWALADNPFDMARVPVEKIQAVIRPCGLSPQKSKAISVLSRMLVEEHGGRKFARSCTARFFFLSTPHRHIRFHAL